MIWVTGYAIQAQGQSSYEYMNYLQVVQVIVRIPS